MDLYLSNLSKTYSNGVKALKNVSINISNGMFGLLGPNGAGKSTLMRTIATLQEPDTGEASLGDIDLLKNPIELRKILGYLPQSFGVYPKMNAYDLLHYMGQLKGISNKKERDNIVASALELTNLYDVRFKEVAGYSGGMKQRFGIAQLLLNKPKLIIVDEPTAGLDPAERQRFLNVLREIRPLVGIEGDITSEDELVRCLISLKKQLIRQKAHGLKYRGGSGQRTTCSDDGSLQIPIHQVSSFCLTWKPCE